MNVPQGPIWWNWRIMDSCPGHQACTELLDGNNKFTPLCCRAVCPFYRPWCWDNLYNVIQHLFVPLLLTWNTIWTFCNSKPHFSPYYMVCKLLHWNVFWITTENFQNTQIYTSTLWCQEKKKKKQAQVSNGFFMQMSDTLFKWAYFMQMSSWSESAFFVKQVYEYVYWLVHYINNK